MDKVTLLFDDKKPTHTKRVADHADLVAWIAKYQQPPIRAYVDGVDIGKERLQALLREAQEVREARQVDGVDIGPVRFDTLLQGERGERVRKAQQEAHEQWLREVQKAQEAREAQQERQKAPRRLQSGMAAQEPSFSPEGLLEQVSTFLNGFCRKKLIQAFSVLLLGIGVILVCLTPGGLLNKVLPPECHEARGSSAYRFLACAERASLDLGQAGPVTGFTLMGIGALGLVYAYAKKDTEN